MLSSSLYLHNFLTNKILSLNIKNTKEKISFSGLFPTEYSR